MDEASHPAHRPVPDQSVPPKSGEHVHAKDQRLTTEPAAKIAVLGGEASTPERRRRTPLIQSRTGDWRWAPRSRTAFRPHRRSAAEKAKLAKAKTQSDVARARSRSSRLRQKRAKMSCAANSEISAAAVSTAMCSAGLWYAKLMTDATLTASVKQPLRTAAGITERYAMPR